MNRSQAGKIKARIRRLMKTAETGAQWAEICALEARLVNAGFQSMKEEPREANDEHEQREPDGARESRSIDRDNARHINRRYG